MSASRTGGHRRARLLDASTVCGFDQLLRLDSPESYCAAMGFWITTAIVWVLASILLTLLLAWLIRKQG